MSYPKKETNSLWSRFVTALFKYSKLYCRCTKLAGLKYLVETDRTWFDRTLWFLVYAITMPAMVYTVYYGYLEFMESPLLTTVETDYFPTQKLDYPGISICSVNRISRRSAMELANEVLASNVTDFTMDQILSMISQLGDLYDSDFQTQTIRLHRIDHLLSIFYGGHYNVTDLMKRLTPQCSSTLSKCRFRDEERNCSELFEFRKTQNGFCCTFNYATKGDDTPLSKNVDYRKEPIKVHNLTQGGGLSVLLEPFLDDYFYPIFPIRGWKVTVFNPYDYPDDSSGGVTDILISPGMHSSIEITARVFYSMKSIQPYSLEKRHCVFSEEMSSFREFYSYSDCLVDCRIEDTWELCGCIPFFLPNRKSRRVCNLEDVSCLSEHKSKWISVVPHEDSHNDPSLDKKNVLHCHNCYPECSDVKYITAMSTSHLKSNQYISKLLDGVVIKDQGVLTVYFSKLETTKFRQDAIYQWYELMADVSGICGIFVGFSLISIVEFAYFIGLFVLELLNGSPSSLLDENEKRTVSKQSPSMRTIYWDELYSNARTKENQRALELGSHEHRRDFIHVVVRKLDHPKVLEHSRGSTLDHRRR